MPTRDERRTRLAADLDALRQVVATARQGLKALPPKANRTAADRRDAARLRTDLVLARAVLNALGAPTDDDLADQE
jgi:hypothetical protein